jgi:hypothetical protein
VLVYLSRALDCQLLPIQLAEDFVCPADLPGFVEEIEKRTRALLGFINMHLENHSITLRPEDNPVVAQIVDPELADARKNLDLLDKLRAMRRRAAIDFSAEAEELRKLRSGELKIAHVAKRPCNV